MKIAVVILLATLVASTAGVRLFPYGSRVGDANLGANDDGSATRSMYAFKFYGNSYTRVRIYNNGYLGLSSSYVGGFTPRPFPFHGAPMIAPYWADHDARAGIGRTWFRVSRRPADLYKAAQLVRCAYHFDITPTQVVVVTWYRLGYFNRHTNRLNTHQAVLVTNGRHSFVLFLYGSINWTTGDASGGRHGFGGYRARAGLNRGDGTKSVTIPGSGTSSIVNIETTSNVGVRGLYVFRTDLTIVRLRAPGSYFFPYGQCANDLYLPANDDGSRVVSSGPVKMYGRTFTTTRVYNNGYLSLGSGSTGGFTPRPYPFRSNNVIMVAPYWADVDTRSGDGSVYYRRTTLSTLRTRAGNYVRRIYGVPFNPTSLFIVTWSRVGYYSQKLNKRNTYQCVLATDAYRTFVIYVYGTLQWTTGEASSGHNGLGGRVASPGINAGDGRRSVTMPGSGIQSRMLSLYRQSNMGYNGVYVLSPTAVLYPRGSLNLGRTDDGSRQIPFRVPFYGRTLTTANICNNGYVSLGTRFCRFTPQRYPISTPMVAPYWADADAYVGLGRTYYRVTTSVVLRQRVKFEVEATRNTIYNPTKLLIVTWYRLGYYRRHQDKLNTFQAVIATDGRRTYTIYNYENIQWTTGDASRGRNGFGGIVARAGNNGGVGRRHVTLPQSGNQPRMLALESATNVRMPGTYILQAHPAISAAMVEDAPVVDVEYHEEVDKSEFEAAPLADEEVNSLADELDNLAEPYMEEMVEEEAEDEYQGDESVEVEGDEGVDVEEEYPGDEGVDVEEEYQEKEGVDVEEEYQEEEDVEVEEEYQEEEGVEVEEEYQGDIDEGVEFEQDGEIEQAVPTKGAYYEDGEIEKFEQDGEIEQAVPTKGAYYEDGEIEKWGMAEE